jgi:cytochrome c
MGIGDSSFIGYKNIDLNGIIKIDLLVQAPPRLGAVGGIIEVHLDSPGGPIIGKTETIVPKDVNFRAFMAQLTAEAKKKGQNGPPDMPSIRRLALTTATAHLVATQGFHDIYFVFENDKAKPEQIIAQISEIIFHN